MEANKVRSAYGDAPQKLLLPLSLGVSSIALLHVLDQHLRAQNERNCRTSYTLHVLFIDQPGFLPQAERMRSLGNLRHRFPLHTFSVAPLEEVLEYRIPHLDEVFQTKIAPNENFSLSRQAKLEALLSALPSTTSRLDIINILCRRLTIAYAECYACSSIIFGDSTTRLAERTLSETAKGRGASLPWLTADSISSDGLRVSYPMRDLLKRELLLYMTVTDPPLEPLVVGADSLKSVSLSSKGTTIDGLMSEYFESVEQNYPSIVANVVRTVGRLAAPTLLSDFPSCGICGLPVDSSSQGLVGNQRSILAPLREQKDTSCGAGPLCYGCTRSVAAS